VQHVTIIATSLNPESKSQLLAAKLAGILETRNVPTTTVDLRELDLPLAGAPGCWEGQEVATLNAAVAQASHVVFATPIYCYDVNAAAKNVIELVGRGFTDKVVGFVCTAGGQGSYMSVMGLANHLMLDFRSVIVPRYVYATGEDWGEDGEPADEIVGRLEMLCDDMARIEVASAGGDQGQGG